MTGRLTKPKQIKNIVALRAHIRTTDELNLALAASLERSSAVVA
jgi:hypothetical protein